MNESRYRWVLYIIVIVILGTIMVQAHWNYKNYLVNKQQLINDVQLSIDTAVENYFANLAETNTIAFALSTNSESNIISKEEKSDDHFHILKDLSNRISNPDSLDIIELTKNISLTNALKYDTVIKHTTNNDSISKWHAKTIRKIIAKPIDSLNFNSFKTLTSKVLISMASDSLKLDKINNLVKEELSTKALDIQYKLVYKNQWNGEQETINNTIENTSLALTSKSAFLPRNSILEIYFSNDNKIILKRMLSSLLISTLLVMAVISCLFYLLKIIKQQKQIAEVKNDLISNITHEFKTPIATIGVAIESIKSFNVIDDKEKTKNYLDVSENQLSKLNIMVEKLLETATLDSESLKLNKEETNITDLITVLVNKHKMQTGGKTITLLLPEESITAGVDVFHFENTLNNIIDNAIKYGGNTIKVELSRNPISFTVSICDNGNTLTKGNKDKIFEKFYRIPKGNTHDVKGFGIGLYYAKKIVEKHGGSIQLDLDNKRTCFKISLPSKTP